MGLSEKILDLKYRRPIWLKTRTRASQGIMPSKEEYTDLAGLKCTTKAAYKFLKKKTAKKAAPAKPTFVEKPIGGAKNGGTRMVRVKKAVNDYPTIDAAPKGTSKNFFAKHKRTVRASLAPGAVAILLAGVHKGKRVIVLKQLSSGLLLITGPMKCNGCPLRRVNQIYLLATSAKV